MSNSGGWSKVLWPLRERDFRLMWSGNLVSRLGDGIFTVAIALEALRVDHQPTGLAYVLAARAVPSVLFALLGGVVVDRVSRRATLLVADLGQAAAVGVIAILVLAHAIGLGQLIVMAMLFGIADAFSGPAFMALVPELLPVEVITQANALNSTSSELSVNLIGPALGGLAVAFVGIGAALGFDAASFIVSAGCLAGLHHRARPAPSGKSILAEAAEGIHYIVSRRWLFVLLIGAAIANLFGLGPFIVLVPVLIRHVLHASPVVLGLVYSGAGAAGVVASLVAARLGSPRHLTEAMWAAYSGAGILLAGIFLAPGVAVAAILIAGSSGLVVYGDVLYFTKLQTSVPTLLLGRVSSVSYLIVGPLIPLGMILGGFAASVIGARAAFLASGLLAAACGLVLFVPGARDLTAE